MVVARCGVEVSGFMVGGTARVKSTGIRIPTNVDWCIMARYGSMVHGGLVDKGLKSSMHAPGRWMMRAFLVVFPIKIIFVAN